MITLVAGVLLHRFDQLGEQIVAHGLQRFEVGGREMNEEVVGDDATILRVDAAVGIDLFDETTTDLDGANVASERTAEHTFDHMPYSILA